MMSHGADRSSTHLLFKYFAANQKKVILKGEGLEDEPHLQSDRVCVQHVTDEKVDFSPSVDVSALLNSPLFLTPPCWLACC